MQANFDHLDERVHKPKLAGQTRYSKVFST
jgi:hypothetical protein